MGGILNNTPPGTTPAGWFGNSMSTRGGWLPRYPGNNFPGAPYTPPPTPAPSTPPQPTGPPYSYNDPSTAGGGGAGDTGTGGDPGSDSGGGSTGQGGPTPGQQMGAILSGFTSPNALATGLSQFTGLSPRVSQAGIGLAGLAPVVGTPLTLVNMLATLYSGITNSQSNMQALNMAFNPANFASFNTDTDFGDFGSAPTGFGIPGVGLPGMNDGGMGGLNGPPAVSQSQSQASQFGGGGFSTAEGGGHFTGLAHGGFGGSPSNNAPGFSPNISLNQSYSGRGQDPTPDPAPAPAPGAPGPTGTPAGVGQPGEDDGGMGGVPSGAAPSGSGAGSAGDCSLMSFAVQRLQPQDAAQTQQFMRDFYQKFMQQNPRDAKRLFAGYQQVAKGIIAAAVKTGQEDEVAQYIYDQLIAPFGNTLDDSEVPAAVQHMAMVVRGLREHFGIKPPPPPKFQGKPLGVNGQQFTR